MSAQSASMLEIVALDMGDDAQSWGRAGFTVEGDTVRVGTVAMRCGASGVGVVGWTVRGIPIGTVLDGLPTTVTDGALGTPAVHANGATIIDHVVIATPDVDRTVASFVVAGCDPKRERKGGSESMPIRQVFVRAGEVILEIIGPPTVSDDPDVAARPATFWGLAFTTADLDACALLLADALSPPKDAVQTGRRIATLRHKPLGITVPTVFMS